MHKDKGNTHREGDSLSPTLWLSYWVMNKMVNLKRLKTCSIFTIALILIASLLVYSENVRRLIVLGRVLRNSEPFKQPPNSNSIGEHYEVIGKYERETLPDPPFKRILFWNDVRISTILINSFNLKESISFVCTVFRNNWFSNRNRSRCFTQMELSSMAMWNFDWSHQCPGLRRCYLSSKQLESTWFAGPSITSSALRRLDDGIGRLAFLLGLGTDGEFFQLDRDLSMGFGLG